jgi:Domain of unknown function (DUF4926)
LPLTVDHHLSEPFGSSKLEKASLVGTVVLVHPGNTGYEVEFMTLDSQTVAIVSLFPSQLRPIARREIAHARTVG